MDLYITAFLDILGQREKLKPITLKEIKTNQINSENIVKNLAHQVLLMRESFASYFNSWNIETPDMLNITEKEKKEILKSREENILFQGFSDSVCISVLLDENDFYFKTMKSINSVFLAISTIFYKALINKYCFRGGLEIGMGLKISENEIYGPVLEHAYSLEHEKAINPRVLIGNSIIDFLNQICSQANFNFETLCSTGLASETKNMIFKDKDNCFVLDWLGQTSRNNVNFDLYKTESYKIENIRNFINLQMYQHREDISILEKYEYLNEYVNSRSHLWQ